MRRFLMAVLILSFPVAASAQTLTTRDIISLTRAGLSEEVLLALIEVHRPVFPVDADTMKALLDAGVHKNVIVAMVKSGRETPAPESLVEPEPAPAPAPPPPQVVIVEHEREQPVHEVVIPVAVPVYVPVRVHPRRDFDPIFDRDFDRRFDRDHRVRRTEPVFWGFGGKLRPDAWQPDDPRTRTKSSDPRQKK